MPTPEARRARIAKAHANLLASGHLGTMGCPDLQQELHSTQRSELIGNLITAACVALIIALVIYCMATPEQLTLYPLVQQ